MKLLCCALFLSFVDFQVGGTRVAVEVIWGDDNGLAERDLGEDISKRKAVLSNRIWPNGVVPYEFTANVAGGGNDGGNDEPCVNHRTYCGVYAWFGYCSFYTTSMSKYCPAACDFCSISNNQEQSLGDRIEIAMEDYHNYTCLRFRRKESSDSHYVRFKTIDSGCYSYVGRIGGVQEINIQGNVQGSTCDVKHIILHEIGHAIGMYHEQSRPDRDDFVTINTGNIRSGFESNFDKCSSCTTHNVPYDYMSIMHYGQADFSRNGLPTVITKDPHFQNIIGTTERLSMLDLAIVNEMYSCPTRYFWIRNQAHDKFLNRRPNNRVNFVDKKNSDSQYWYLDGRYIRNRAVPGRVLTMDITNQGISSGLLTMENPADADNQHWELISEGIQNAYNNLEIVIGRKENENSGTAHITAFGVTPTGKSYEKLDLQLVESLL